MSEPDRDFAWPSMAGALVDYDSQPYWHYCRSKDLRLPYCLACQRFVYFPRSRCPKCWSADVEWRPVGRTGRIYTFVISRDARVSALVELDDAPYVRLPVPIVNQTPTEVTIGQPVQLTWTDDEEFPLPAFEPMGLN